MKFLISLLFVTVGMAVAFPQREGVAFSNEAIKQAQSTLLIPKDAEIHNVYKHIIHIEDSQNELSLTVYH